MARDYFITARNNPDVFRDVQKKGGVETYTFDASAWAEDNNTITTATWSVEKGNATISGQALASNVASAQVSFPEAGGSLIKLLLDTGTELFVVHVDVIARNIFQATRSGLDLESCGDLLLE